jgi:tetratricopeptide (TPR) repeat protein
MSMQVFSSGLRSTFLLAACIWLGSCSGSGSGGGDSRGNGDANSSLGSYLAGHFARAVNDTGAAATYFDRALATDPDNLALLQRTLLLKLADGRIDDSLELARRAARVNPRAGFAHLVLVSNDIKTGNLSSAKQRLDTAPRAEFDALLRPLLLGWTLVGSGDVDGGVKAIEDLDERGGYAPFKSLHLALVNDLAGRNPVAEAAYRKSLAANNGGSARAVEALGSLLERTDRRDEAIEQYRNFLARVPENAAVAAALDRAARRAPAPRLVGTAAEGAAEAVFGAAAGLALSNPRNREPAMIYLRLALHLRPNLWVGHALLAELMESDKRWTEAIEAYRRIDPASPYGWDARVRMAALLDQTNQTDEAVKLLRSLVAERPADWSAAVTLGDILRARERFPDAVSAYDTAVQRVSSIEERHWTLLYARGIALERAKQWERAEKDFQRALELKPDQPQVLNYLGYSWVEQGRNYDQALKMIDKAVQQRPSDGYIVDSLGWVHYRLGNFAEAVRYLERAVELRPGDPTINDHLGDAYWMVGRRLEARFQWRRALTLKPEADLVPQIEGKIDAGLETPARRSAGG